MHCILLCANVKSEILESRQIFLDMLPAERPLKPAVSATEAHIRAKAAWRWLTHMLDLLRIFQILHFSPNTFLFSMLFAYSPQSNRSSVPVNRSRDLFFYQANYYRSYRGNSPNWQRQWKDRPAAATGFTRSHRILLALYYACQPVKFTKSAGRLFLLYRAHLIRHQRENT